MAQFIELGNDTTLKIRIPRKLSSDWADLIREECFLKIVNHDHSGADGLGAKVAAGGIEDDAVDGTTLLLLNDQWLRSLNSVNSPANVIKLNTNNRIELGAALENLTIAGALNIPLLAGPPASPNGGDLYVDDGTNRPAGVYAYDGTAWVASPNNITASNQGAGEGLFIQKTGDDLEFKSITTDGSITLTPSTNELELSVTPENVVAEVTGASINSTFIDAFTFNLNAVDLRSISSGSSFVGNVQPDTTYKLKGEIYVNVNTGSSFRGTVYIKPKFIYNRSTSISSPDREVLTNGYINNAGGSIQIEEAISFYIESFNSNRAVLRFETSEFTTPQITGAPTDPSTFIWLSLDIGISQGTSETLSFDPEINETTVYNFNGQTITKNLVKTSKISLIEVD